MIKKIQRNIKIYYNNIGQISRIDDPAIELSNGSKYWYLNGKQHREDGPASECTDGKYWYKEGYRHRADGPAIEYIAGNKIYFLHSFKMKKHRFNSWINRIEILGLHVGFE